MPRRGDIVLARFPFTDHSGAKLRPVLVLAEIPGSYRDFIVLFISSPLGQAVPGLDVVLDPTHPAFRSSGLKVTSVFRVAKVASLSDALLAGVLGRLEPEVLDEIVSRLTRLLETGKSPDLAGEGAHGGR
ncbi:MAG: type II toxin-antitoxin system PemK/MazF family toxin [Chloroflexi bacterium]|nr:type II toxin-antitoxin system PemK/MazF family toxin [Chloroflexota bacterium]